MVYRIANFGDGKINAFDINSGNFIAPLKNRRGEPLDFNGLWALFFASVSAYRSATIDSGRRSVGTRIVFISTGDHRLISPVFHGFNNRESLCISDPNQTLLAKDTEHNSAK